MTFEELLDYPSEKLKKITNEELLEYFKPYLTITRPELAEKPVKDIKSTIKSMTSVSPKKQQKINKAKEIFEKFGFDIDNL